MKKIIILQLDRLVSPLADQELKVKASPEKEKNELKRPSQQELGHHLLKMMKVTPSTEQK